jgi:iron complex transport system substrate-binding protein
VKIFCLLIVFVVILSGGFASAAPERIVSLAPNVTEILFALGVGDRIVGVTSFCDYPPESKKKTSIGGMSNPSFEAVLSLRPDLVILTEDGNQKAFEERIRKRGIKTFVFKARRMSELPAEIAYLGKILGAEKSAACLSRSINNSMANIKAREINSHNSKALFIIWPEPLLVAGTETAIDDSLVLLGVKNIASDTKTRYPQYSIEEVIRRNPDIIFIGKGHEDMQNISTKLLSKLQMVNAVKNGRVYFISDNLYRLGPRVIDGIKELAGYIK